MSLRINTNVASLQIQGALSRSQSAIEKSMKGLSTGSRLSDASNDVASLSIADKLSANIKGSEAALRNAQNAQSFSQVAEGSLAEQSNLLVRMKEIAVQGASDTYSDKERAYMQTEVDQLREEIDRIAQNTSFGGSKLINGSSSKYDFQVGTENSSNSIIKFNNKADSTSRALDVSSISVTDKDNARDALESVDNALNSISEQRAQFGALQSRLASSENTLQTQIENYSSAKSVLSDVDFAAETSMLRRQQILQQYQVALLNKADDQAQSALRLIA